MSVPDWSATGSRVRVTIPDDCGLLGNTNGGVLLSAAVRGMTAMTDHPDPVSVTGHFARAHRGDPVWMATEIIRVGARFTTCHAVLHGEDGPILTVLATFGDLEGSELRTLVGQPPPSLANPSDCKRVRTGVDGRDFFDVIETRIDPRWAGFLRGEPSGAAELSGWCRLPWALDTVDMITVADAFPATAFNLAGAGWAPTISLDVLVRAVPADGWMRASFTSALISGDTIETDGVIWDERDVVVAQTRQLALLPRASDA